MTSPARALELSQLWRPAEHDTLEGRVVSLFGRWPTIMEPLRTIVLEVADGRRVHVLRAYWVMLRAELVRVRPNVGDRLRLERVEDVRGRRVFRVERIGAATDTDDRDEAAQP